uniref:Pyrin domain-containing protein n=1 Tax=Mastacembelus armatus TaxID=205130 RepID=A0A3Q3LLN5_9TELE
MEMNRTTIKRALKDALADLSGEGLLEFCDELRDRRTEPRITRRSVEGKSYLQIIDLLVSTYTEQGALTVVLETLRKINCNQLAETLSSKTKACADKGDPVFRKTSNGELDSKPSQEALKYRGSHQPLTAAGAGGSPGTAKKPEEVEAEAKKQVLSECGDPCNERLVLSRSKIQFGKYKGQTFQWLLENDVDYTAYIIITHQKEREHTMCQTPLMANKVLLIEAKKGNDLRFLSNSSFSHCKTFTFSMFYSSLK